MEMDQLWPENQHLSASWEMSNILAHVKDQVKRIFSIFELVDSSPPIVNVKELSPLINFSFFSFI